jgi:hypothetical protein
MARSRESFTASEIVIEVNTPLNNNLLFKPLSMTLRGRWDNSRATGDWDYESTYRNMPVVPGIYVCLDLKAKTLRAVDPLSFEENAGLLSQVKAAALKHQGEVGPATEVRRERLTDTEVKTALWEMHQHVEEKHATMVRGEMPRRDEVLGMPGQLLLRPKGGAANLPCYDPEYHLSKPLPPWATEQELERLGVPAPAKAG